MIQRIQVLKCETAKRKWSRRAREETKKAEGFKFYAILKRKSIMT